MDMNQYLDVFIEESKEHLQSCSQKLLELEKNPEDSAIVNEIFRSAHTLKGMSATMGYTDLANLTHHMENVLDAIRHGKLSVKPAVLDAAFEAVDLLEEMVLSIAGGGNGKKDVLQIIEKFKKLEGTEDQAVLLVPSEPMILDDFERTVIQQGAEQGYQPYEITVFLREDCLLKAARVFMIFELGEKLGEIIKSVPAADMLEEEKFDSAFSLIFVSKEKPEDIQSQMMKVSEVERVEISPLALDQSVFIEKDTEKLAAASEAEAETAAAKVSGSSKTIRVNIERLDSLMNLFEELVIDRGRLEQISKDLKNSELNETVEHMSRISGDLQTIILNMRMVPVETVFNRFPRMVRQLAKDLNKKIHLSVTGAETELDRTVIDEIGDPLVHLLRNALDHGIETPEQRRMNGKPEEGNVALKAYHSGNYVFIDIEDDGAGISRQRILKKALERGLVTERDAADLSDEQVYDFMFASGFSTASTISDVSGRGVGLDVVKNTIESLGGSITIQSREGFGSLFSIQLPLTLSIISVLLVKLASETFAIPISSIIETAVIRRDEILSAHNQKVIDYRGKIVPLVSLKEILEVPCDQNDDSHMAIVIVKKGDRLAALMVDSFIGQQEIVLKPLGNYLNSVFAVSGATILGDGQVALIIDCNALIK
ncbi:chemotaxis protein CheA [Metabacillus indicus]|uniref:chemotaxis protein CheA n=1 Tax=Metabacillus indicus TaxID=246786 RepID=UPI002A0376B8|nr:chemotaxis protein CheA [Metabacillus indicus]MDX8288384.1 chemotaxis protein CheA [Metabacillus indicus]